MTVAIAPSETSESPEPSETPEMPSVAEEFAGSEWSEPSAEPGDADGATDEASVDPADVSPLVARDAQEFGAYARTGGWAFGLKVARSVRPGGQAAGETPKVSAKEFAALADCSPERVMRYYKAWDKAADDGVVPHFEALAPGAEVELPGADLWLTYYSARSSAGSERGAAISEAAEAEGIRPTKALEVAENPTALRAAIMADPSTARAARHALLDRIKEDPDLQAELARDIVRTDDLKKAVATESRSADRVGYVRQIAESGQVKTPAGQTIEAPVDLRQEAERHLSLLDELDEDEDTGEWASEAYDTLKNLVVEAVEADPELRVQERRTKFYSSLTKATKAFEELTFDDVQEFAEDDMVQQLEELQEAIASCITALRGARTSPA
ncbi:hypothetical protein ACKI1I_20270 [Streptomyces turgidiscabies]|uniref:Uncharacterized protein n=1 Tax=Streptomyces turgidiscabies (strain Car8) TaxID=698760 RepID=L7FGM5_STRT8|nr:hypothetical protein [Streptomyces turgidiscabies]ELP70477.1 hypothetical protein STRTUCAR8_09703 [Streptomyces turgidiscabies Car8]MDX3491996.1 hypothetical protein [Streptomyces turgidiscabies]GAQ71886.1 hypothetical protein T45_03631 [Streptomyces turgidiscabies]